MAQLTVRLDDEVRESLDALARARGLSTSDLIRALIDGALGQGVGERLRADPTPRSLTAFQRRLLFLQHETLALLSTRSEDAAGDEAGYHRRMMQSLNGGFSTEYGTMFQEMSTELSRRESDLVHDILAMFHILHFSVGQLSEAERAALGEDAERALTFAGFDFNDAQESRLHSYAQYLVNGDAYRSMAVYFDDRHDGGNSHFPWLAAYERMLSVWRPMRDRKFARPTAGPGSYAYGLDELRAIHAARPSPRS